MKPPLLIALAVVLGATLYLNGQDDADIDVVRGGERAAPRAPTDAAGPRSPAATDTPARRGAMAGAPAGAARMADAVTDRQAWIGANLKQGLGAWRARRAGVNLPTSGEVTMVAQRPTDSGAGRAHSAWAAQQPPAPPRLAASVVRQDARPVTPVAPAFPHQWVGSYHELPVGEPRAAGGASQPQPQPQPQLRAIVAGAAQTWVVKPGDVIEGQWRVDSIQSRTLQLTYLPLMVASTVAMK